MNLAVSLADDPIALSNSGFQPVVTHTVPVFVQVLTGIEPSNQTSSPGYAWIVRDLLLGTVTDSLYEPFRSTIVFPEDALLTAATTVLSGAA